MTETNADSRDAKYLACQLKTNSVVLHQRARITSELNKLHQIYLEVSEEAGMPLTVSIPAPSIDTSQSQPRLRAIRDSEIPRLLAARELEQAAHS